MLTQIDASNSEFTRLGILFKAVDEGSTKPTKDTPQPTYDALAVPEDIPGRQALNVRLLDLFIASSGDNGFNHQQLGELRASLERAMPDPEKYPDQFVAFVSGRCHGTLEMLRLLVSYTSKCAKKGNGENALKEAELLGEDKVVDGMPEPLNGLEASVRNSVMHTRVERVLFLQQTCLFQESNARLYPAVKEKYRPFKSAFEGVVVAYRENIGRMVEKMSMPEFAKAKFWNALLNNLNVCDLSKPEEVTARLERLDVGLKAAYDVDSFTTAINDISKPL